MRDPKTIEDVEDLENYVEELEAENAALREAAAFALRHLHEIALFQIVPTAVINALSPRTTGGTEVMEAPEKLYVLRSDAEDLAVLEDGRCDSVLAGSSPLHNMHGDPATVEYTRSDLCTMPGELVEEAKDAIFWINGGVRTHRCVKFVESFLAWHEGKG